MLAQRTPTITICPPGKAAGSESREATICGRRPVGVRFEADGEVTSTGIGFEDYSKMHSVTIKRGSNRRFETPRWILDKRKFEEVFLTYCDARVDKNTSYIKDRNLRLNEIARLWRAAAAERERVLDRLCNM